MPYPSLLGLSGEAQYRAHFETTYCAGPVFTFDGVEVRFRRSDFDHCCFESSRRDRSKDRFSRSRAERLDWIGAALRDPNAELFIGWDRNRKRYDPNRRVAVVMQNYVVVIAITGPNRADFVTAYLAETQSQKPARPSTLDRIRSSPKWPRKNR